MRERVPVDEDDVGPLGQRVEPVEELLLRVEQRLLLQLQEVALEGAGRALLRIVPTRDAQAGDRDDRVAGGRSVFAESSRCASGR